MSIELHGDRMASKERMAAFAAGREIDRIPCSLFLGETAARFIGKTVSEYHHSPAVMAEVEIFTFRMFGQDGVGVGPGLFGVAEAMGTRLSFPEDGIAYVAEPALKGWSDLDRLKPPDPHRDGRLPLWLEALQLLKEKLGDQVGVGTSVGGPFTVAASLRGTSQFLRDLRKNPAMAHHLLKLATEGTLRYIDMVCDLEIYPGFADPIASGTVIGADQFQEFAQPYLKICLDRIIERSGNGTMLHICGDSSRIWEGMADTGAATLSLDNMNDLAEAKVAVGNRVCLMGNVAPVTTIGKGRPEDVIAEARTCLRKAYDSPKGFILSPGCQIPIGAPVENIQALMDAARTYGRWPIDPERLKP
jgi:uroporphyrinogen decarboxylase